MIRALITGMDKEALTGVTVTKMLGPGLERLFERTGNPNQIGKILKRLTRLAEANPEEFGRTVERLARVASKVDVAPGVFGGDVMKALWRTVGPSASSSPIATAIVRGLKDRPQLYKRFESVIDTSGRILAKAGKGMSLKDKLALAAALNSKDGIDYATLRRLSPQIAMSLRNIGTADVKALERAIVDATRAGGGYISDFGKMYGRKRAGDYMRWLHELNPRKTWRPWWSEGKGSHRAWLSYKSTNRGLFD